MSQPYLAQISIISFNFPPRNWAFCNGQTLPINQNQALFSLLGTTYGGNGQTTFALPNFQGRAPIEVGNGYPLGTPGGEANHTLTVGEMASHTHTARGDTATANTGDPTGGSWATLPATTPLYAPAPNATMSTNAIGNTGGSQPHPNLQPYLVLNFIISLVGVYPSRN